MITILNITTLFQFHIFGGFMVGRRSKLTEELTKTICENIELGMSYNLSCQAAGITFKTFRNWMRAGEAEEDKKHIDFYSAVQAAEAQCAKNCLVRIQDSAEQGNVNYDIWLLERRYPADYGKKDMHNIMAKAEVTNVNCDITDDDRIEIMKKLCPPKPFNEEEDSDRIAEIHRLFGNPLCK